MGVLTWLNEWTRTAGFAGVAAVIAAAIAYSGVRRTNRSDAALAADNQWWEQARWASERLSRDERSAAIGLAAFDELLDAAPGSKAAGFVRAAMGSLIDAPSTPTESVAPTEVQTRQANRRKAAQLYVSACQATGAPVPDHVHDLATHSGGPADQG
jgi:hypothetical protein